MLTESIDGAGRKDYDKQDSEQQAFERLAGRLKGLYLKLPIFREVIADEAEIIESNNSRFLSGKY